MNNPLEDLREMLESQWATLRGRERIMRLLREIRHELKPKIATHSIVVHFTGESMNNALVLNVGQTSQASIQPLLADGVTPSGGVVSAVSYTFSDPSATVVLNAEGLNATIRRCGLDGCRERLSGLYRHRFRWRGIDVDPGVHDHHEWH